MDILVADDEKTIAITLRDDLVQAGHQVTIVAEGIAARDELDRHDFDVLITDIKMPGMSGIELLIHLKERHPETEVIVMTGYGTIESAVAAMKSGAFEYILKPFFNEEMIHVVTRIAELKDLRREKNQLEIENIELKEELGQRYEFDNIVGRSTAMRKVFDLIRTVAPTESNILIEGESGTGKELTAKAIHHNSTRKDGAFVAFSCAEKTPTLLEDALFGHEQGAFTDARSRHIGLFERAEGGTLFLDEIDDTPLSFQVKLLRVLQERTIERLGGEATISVDVRILAASKIDLADAVREGEFREDLYWRLNVVPVKLPPLRDREGDVRLLTEKFLQRYGAGRPYTITEKVVERMEGYSWPGNVRQLENAIERAIAMAGDRTELREEHLLADRFRMAASETESKVQTLKEAVRDAEIRTITAVLKFTGGHKAQSAKILGISRKNLWEKMRDYGVES